MARKGNQHKNGLDRNSANHKKEVPDSGFGSPNSKRKGKLSERKLVSEGEPQSDNWSFSTVSESSNQTDHVVDGEKSEHKSKKSLRKDKQSMGVSQGVEHQVPSDKGSGDCIETFSETGPSGSKEEKGRLASSIRGSKHSKRSSGRLANGLRRYDMMSNIEFSDALILRHLRVLALSILETATTFMERHKPLLITLKTHVSRVVSYSRKKIEYAYPIVLKWLVHLRNTVQKKIRYAYPIILRWLMHLGNLVLLLGMVWLDCSLRGVDSFLRMGTTSFFSVIWCSILSIMAMVGTSKCLVVLVLSTLAGVVLGITIAILLIGTTGIAFLWFYGSFWTTSLFICAGGLAFMLSHERLALLITTLYSIYCAWTYVGWLGLLLAMNLSFVSSDVLIFFLKNKMDDHRRSDQPNEQPDGMYNQPGFYAQPESTETGFASSADRSPGVPSTSGNDSELTSEDEVIRLLNCTDHYSALGLSRYENVDVSILKREYRKKAMLVHPDKNMGNEKAADAFKKLQNAYEVLLDSLKRKTYDDELRREEVLNYFRRFQNTSQKNGRHSFFAPGFARTETDDDDPFGESRRIACKKCGNFHVWVHSKKSKSTARWCQDCKDFHPAKDGDGWVEQSSQPFLFGMMQKVDAPRAFVCADSKIYDATEWYICQGMRCSVNTHKPSFHVNTSLTPKHGSGKGTSPGQRGGPMPSNMEENMTEEEFFEWLQNAMQAGVFENFAAGGPSDESPLGRAGSFSKSSGGGSTSSSSSKRKKKGKKQR